MSANVTGPSRNVVTNSAPTSVPVRFCKDCKWFFVRYGDNPENGNCMRAEVLQNGLHFIQARKALVTGGGVDAANERGFGSACGFAGKLFEPLPPPAKPPAKPIDFVQSAIAILCGVIGIAAVYFILVAIVSLFRGGGAS